MEKKTDSQDLKGIGSRIAFLRRAAKMTQQALAEKIGVSTKHISHVERECASLSLPCLVEVSRIFGCSLDYLVLGEPHDEALKRLPKTILSILESGNEEEIKRLVEYLQIYADLYERRIFPR